MQMGLLWCCLRITRRLHVSNLSHSPFYNLFDLKFGDTHVASYPR